MYSRFYRSPVVFGGMAVKDLETGWKDSARACFGDKDVFAVFGRGQNRNRIIKGANVNAQPIWPALECQGKLGSASGAEVNVYVFSATFRRERVDRRLAFGEHKVLAFENRFNHSVRTGGALAEPAVADRHPEGFAAGGVCHISAKAVASVSIRQIHFLSNHPTMFLPSTPGVQ